MSTIIKLDEESIAKCQPLSCLFNYAHEQELLVGAWPKYHYHFELMKLASPNDLNYSISGWINSNGVGMNYALLKEAKGLMKELLSQKEKFRELTKDAQFEFRLHYLNYRDKRGERKKLSGVTLEHALSMINSGEISEEYNLWINDH